MNTVNAVALWELSPSVPLPLYYLTNPQPKEEIMLSEKENLASRISILKSEISEREELRKQLEEKLFKLIEAEQYPISESFMMQKKKRSGRSIFLLSATPMKISLDSRNMESMTMGIL